jgi:hypothetical protein
MSGADDCPVRLVSPSGFSQIFWPPLARYILGTPREASSLAALTEETTMRKII